MRIILLIILGLSLWNTSKNIKKAYEEDQREAKKMVNHYYTFNSKKYLTLITDKPVFQLQQLYKINPKKFQIQSYGVIYNDKILFSFSSLREWFKFLSWRKYLEEKKEEHQAWDRKAQENKLLEDMYKDLLSDIEKQKQEAQEMVRQGAVGITKVIDRISQDQV